MTVPEDVREAIARRLNRVAYHLEDGLGPNGLLYPYSAEQADIVRGLLDDLHAVSDWLDAQPAAPEPERWEPVTENSIACACGDRECSTSLEFWEGNNIALCYMGESDYDGREVHRVMGDIVLPADVRLCRRMEATP